MTATMEKIANSELEVLKVLWKSERELTIKEIRKTLADKTGWESPRVATAAP